MHTLRADNENSCYLNVRTLICVVIMVLATGFMTGCSKDESAGAPEDTFEVPFSVYWDAEPVLTIEEETDMGPHIAVTHSAGRIHMAYYDDNPDYVAPPEDYIPDPDDPPLYPFCIR